MTTIPGVFYFSFYNDDDGSESLYGFTFSPTAVHILKPLLEDGDFYEEVCDDIESQFGVHDWSSSPDVRVEGIGYTTYEIVGDQIENCMQTWYNKFVELVGADNVGTNWFEIPVDKYDNDYAIYEFLINREQIINV
jgi:hypothetical protein